MIIGFNGLKGSGKSTASAVLETNGFIKISLATPLKDIVSRVLKKPLSMFNDPEKKDKRLFPNSVVTKEQALQIVREARRYWGFDDNCANAVQAKLNGFYYDSPRQILQFVGDECFRKSVDPDFWINVLKKSIRVTHNYVIEDVRYDNEVEYILNNGGIVVKIYKEGLTKDGHNSEQGITTYNFKIDNNGSKEDFESKIKGLITNATPSSPFIQ